MYNFCLKSFERKDKYRFFIQKKVERKNKVTKDLSRFFFIERFNGYETNRHKIGHQPKADFTPSNIVYDPVYDEHTPIPCYFTDQIHLAYRSHISKNINGNETIVHSTVRQFQYCENFFARKIKRMNVFAAKEVLPILFKMGK